MSTDADGSDEVFSETLETNPGSRLRLRSRKVVLSIGEGEAGRKPSNSNKIIEQLDGVIETDEVEYQAEVKEYDEKLESTKEEFIPESIDKIRVFILNDERKIGEVELEVLSVLQQNKIIVLEKETALNFSYRKSFLLPIEPFNSEQIFIIDDQLREDKSKISIQIEYIPN